MASRFWVGGSGNWDAATTTHWSATTGGAGGASVPTSVDSVFIDALSGSSPTITITATANCLDLTFTGAITPTFAGSSNLNIFGNLILISAMTLTYSGVLSMTATATGKTITTAGITLTSMTFNGVGGGWTLQDNLSTSSNISFIAGAFVSNNKSISCSSVSSTTTTNVRSITLGSSLVTCTSASNGWNVAATNLTLTAGTSTITFTGSPAFIGGGLTYYNVVFSGATPSIAGANTFNTVTIAAGCTLSLTSAITQTITTLVSNGTVASAAVLKSVTGASAATISTPSTLSVTFLTVQDITRTGAGTLAVVNGTNTSGNTGITFSGTRYWINGTGNTNDITHWAYTSGGAGSAPAPTSIDSVYFDSASFSGASQVVTVNATFNCLDMIWTGATNTPTFTGSSGAANIYGSMTLISAMVYTFPNAMNFKSITIGKTITTAGNALSNGLTFDGIGGGWILQDDVTALTKTVTLTNGTLDTNGKTVNFGSFSSVSSNTRTLTLGASVLNLTGAWTLNATGLTFNYNTSTINLIASLVDRTFDGGGATYYNVNIGNTAHVYTIAGSNTFNVLTLTLGSTLKLTSGTNQTVSVLTSKGSLALPSTIQSVTAASAATITLPTGFKWTGHTSFKDITVSSAVALTSVAGTNVSGNTNITFVARMEIGRIKMSDGSFNWMNSTTGVVTKVSG